MIIEIRVEEYVKIAEDASVPNPFHVPEPGVITKQMAVKRKLFEK